MSLPQCPVCGETRFDDQDQCPACGHPYPDAADDDDDGDEDD